MGLRARNLTLSTARISAQTFLAASDVGQRMGDYIEYGEEMNFKLSLT